jgi:three-Cys-motif partner protein
MDDYTWIKKHVTPLVELGKICKKCDPDIYNDFGPWTALKLCALKYYVDVYTTIMDDGRLKKLGFNGRAYLDVFSGSGLNVLRETKTPIAGSTPIAAQFSCEGRQFDRFYALEKEGDYCSALKKRMLQLVPPEKVDIIPGNADDTIQGVLQELEEKRYHYLAFIDYEGVKGLSWNNLQSLLEKKGDIWITFICPGIARLQGSANNLSKLGEAHKRTLINLVGEDVVNNSKTIEELHGNFIKKIQKYRKNTIDMFVRSGDGYYYSLIFATRETYGGSKYVSSVETLRSRIESMSGRFVKDVLDVIEGRRVDLDSFY